MRLGGWQRIGVVLSLLWVVLVCAYAVFEYAAGPDSAMVFIEMVVSKTREPAAVLKGNAFADLVPVEPQILWSRLASVVLSPVIAGWLVVYLLVFAVRWIVTGFKR